MVHIVFVSDNFSSYGLFVWMGVKSSIIGAISHLQKIWNEADILCIVLFKVLLEHVCPITCSVSMPFWFIRLLLR